MAKDVGGWLSKSKAVYGDCSGGGSKGKGVSQAKGGKKDGGKSGPTPYGDSKGGGAGPKKSSRSKFEQAAKGVETWNR